LWCNSTTWGEGTRGNIGQARTLALAPPIKKEFPFLEAEAEILLPFRQNVQGKGLKAVGHRPEVLNKTNVDGAL